MDERTGTFVVTHADGTAAELQDPDSGRVHPLAADPGLAAGEVVEATIGPADALRASWEVRELRERREVVVARSEEPPTRQVREAADGATPGELTRFERAGTGEVHVIAVPPAETEAAVADVLDDEAGLLRRAARLGVGRVEVRAADGVVSVRYLP